MREVANSLPLHRPVDGSKRSAGVAEEWLTVQALHADAHVPMCQTNEEHRNNKQADWAASQGGTGRFGLAIQGRVVPS